MGSKKWHKHWNGTAYVLIYLYIVYIYTGRCMGYKSLKVYKRYKIWNENKRSSMILWCIRSKKNPQKQTTLCHSLDSNLFLLDQLLISKSWIVADEDYHGVHHLSISPVPRLTWMDFLRTSWNITSIHSLKISSSRGILENLASAQQRIDNDIKISVRVGGFLFCKILKF